MRTPHKNVLWVSIVTLCFLFSEVVLVPSSDIQEHFVDIELLSEDSYQDARVRREVDTNLPDQLNFHVPLNKGEVTLRMKRSRLLPTVTSDSDVITPFSKDVAVYTDVHSGAAMIARREESEYSLQGSFLHDQEEWHLEPVERATRGAGGRKSHRLMKGRPNVETISFAGDAYVDNEPPVEILSLSQRNRYRLQRLARLNGKGNNESQRAAVEHIVEMVFVVDHADYQKWVSYKGAANAVNEMTIWYTYIAETIDIRYRTISDSDIAVGSKVIHLKILTTDSEDDFIEDLISSGTFDGGEGLDAFRTWYQEPSSNIPNADHYMYFTGFDIQGASGVAYQDRVCTASGVSITENTFTAGVGAVAAHEFGHSLSASHDVNTGSCSDSTANIMAAIFSIPVTTANRGNPWRFSSCSISSIKSYLSGVTCTEPQNTGSTDVLPAPSGNNRAGIALDRDDQCKQYFQNSASSYCSNSASFYCSGVQSQNGGESSLCGGMFCAIPTNPGFCETVLPLEYTTCGSGKWCKTGSCVDEGVEPTNPPTEEPTEPQTIFDCIPFLFRGDFLGLLTCFRDVLFG
ncbi:hypothetical protein RRG08_067123 [Elysia crispata]|uniref:Peptidase M12B domain-containing protein n=1 Tax=Elysia crispata TaxID=231223 RepID=A0AAE0ZQ05_9GAST|nr:hypothetical protein RRG08_067123 [Elysia crispata]